MEKVVGSNPTVTTNIHNGFSMALVERRILSDKTMDITIHDESRDVTIKSSMCMDNVEALFDNVGIDVVGMFRKYASALIESIEPDDVGIELSLKFVSNVTYVDVDERCSNVYERVPELEFKWIIESSVQSVSS
jgi:hypothetical protein